MKKKFLFLFLFIFFFIFFFNGDVYAVPSAPSAPKLEIVYPQIPFAEPPVQGSPFPVFARYFLLFMISISGIVALFVLTSAGFQYISSAGNQQAIGEAREKIKYGLLGLLIVAGYFIILFTINPNLVKYFGIMPPLDVFMTKLAPGVYLCEKPVNIPRAYQIQKQKGTEALRNENEAIFQEAQDKCFHLSSSASGLPAKINDKAEIIYLVPSPEMGLYYGIILYEQTGFEGHPVLAYTNSRKDEATAWPITKSSINPSSAIPFMLNFQPYPSSFVTLYNDIDWNRKIPDQQEAKAKQQTMYSSSFLNHPGISFTLNPAQLPSLPKAKATWPQIGSLKIEPPNNYIVIFFPDNSPDWNQSTIIDVYIREDNDLNGNIMGGAGGQSNPWNPNCKYESLPGREDNYPCAGAVVIVSGSVF